ncbi:hypothetical protein ACDQ55_11595 [Chitinophaga sp. 30R24]|uniref:hypothetical protein n=1 Tax=Chitinophaga sp. 30R24 TaxID=3248838 RepID=UPI003B921D29
MGHTHNERVLGNNSDTALTKALKLYVQMLLNKSEWTKQLIEELRNELGPDRQQLLTEIIRLP